VVRSRIRISHHLFTSLAIATEDSLADLLAFFHKYTIVGFFSWKSAEWLMRTREWVQSIFTAIRRTLGLGSIGKSRFTYRITFRWGNQKVHLALMDACALRVLFDMFFYTEAYFWRKLTRTHVSRHNRDSQFHAKRVVTPTKKSHESTERFKCENDETTS